MGLIRRYKVTCDKCATAQRHYFVSDFWGFSTPRKARAQAKKDGWGRIPYSKALRSPRYDLCPECLDKLVEGVC